MGPRKKAFLVVAPLPMKYHSLQEKIGLHLATFLEGPKDVVLSAGLWILDYYGTGFLMLYTALYGLGGHLHLLNKFFKMHIDSILLSIKLDCSVILDTV